MDLKEIKNKLVAEKKLVEEELASLGIFDKEKKDWGAQSVPAETADRADDNTAADYSEEYAEKVATVEILEFRLKDINDALKRLANDNYGKCFVCGESIEEKRLLANPAAKTCIKHKEELKPEHITNP
ncbi:MAG TPA: TraR/DksA C4-type zinc finger protein [Candidatus Paceibacterota bacterium]|nr:TraR/DksA C4-type zinc finger protein [Candidatus Paceibacterota bacterium]